MNIHSEMALVDDFGCTVRKALSIVVTSTMGDNSSLP